VPRRRPLAVCFLLRFPSGFPGWMLSSALLCGVRTFLGAPPTRLVKGRVRRARRGHPACRFSVPPASAA